MLCSSMQAAAQCCPEEMGLHLYLESTTLHPLTEILHPSKRRPNAQWRLNPASKVLGKARSRRGS